MSRVPMAQWFIFAQTEALGGLVPWDLSPAGEHPVHVNFSETDYNYMKLFDVLPLIFQFLLVLFELF